jgi:hypothetical protein
MLGWPRTHSLMGGSDGSDHCTRGRASPGSIGQRKSGHQAAHHLYEFRIGRSISYGELDPDWDFAGSSPLPASGASLGDLLARIPGKSKKFTYVYDFGDDWRHTVKLDALVAAGAGASYPRLISAERACPPEDVGGPWGYADYLDAIGDPAHPRHAEMIEWRGEGFDPASVDVVAIQRNLEAFARRTTRRSRAKTYRAIGRYLIRCGSVASAPNRRRLSSS